MSYANNTAEQMVANGAQEITLEALYQAWQQLGDDAVVVDIRKPEDYAQAHVPGSMNLPFAMVDDRCEELKQFGRVYFHCYGGPGAKATATKLAEQGYENLFYVGQAGFGDWAAAGYPTE